MKTDDERATMYHDLVDDALSIAAGRRLEELVAMAPEYQGRIARKYVAEGRAEGRAEEAARLVLTVLTARGLELSADQRARVAACRDLDQLEAWVRQAVTATSTDELFE